MAECVDTGNSRPFMDPFVSTTHDEGDSPMDDERLINSHVGSVGMHTSSMAGTSPAIGTQLRAYSTACANIHRKQDAPKQKHTRLMNRLGKRW